MAREGLKISYRPRNSESCLFVIEAIIEGVVLANIVEMETLYPDFPGPKEAGIVYELPRGGTFDQDQHVGTLSEVMHKKRATCLEVAAIEAAAFRRAGIDAYVELMPMLDAYGKPEPWNYHAVVRMPNGKATDPTAELQGYPMVGHAGKEWWEEAGHCCGSCALGKECDGKAGGCSCGSDHGEDKSKHRHSHHPAAGYQRICSTPAPKRSGGKHHPMCRCKECTQSGLQSYAQGT